MSDFATSLKNILTKGAKFVGKTANSAAKATKYKMDEMSTLGKRRELISALGEKVFELTKQGLALPEEASCLVEQLNAVETDLNALRADHAAQKAAAAEKEAAEKAARAAEKAAAKAAAAIEKSTAPVEPEIPAAAYEMAPDPDEPTVCEAEVPTLEVEQNADASDDIADNEIPTLNV